MLQSPLDNRWYWFGESEKTDTLEDHGVNCYSAATLAGPWKNEGKVFTQEQVVVTGASGPWIIERPKVVYNEKTKLFVMWFHLDDYHTEKPMYRLRSAGVATSPSPTGPYRFVHSLQ